MQQHVASYQQAVNDCHRVMIVSHSQGSFYANSAWSVLYNNSAGVYPMKYFPTIGLMAVATPTSYIGSGLLSNDDHHPIAHYITLDNDWAINSLRAVGYTVLSATHSNNHEDPDWMHHSFVESYLQGDQTGPAMIDQLQAVVDQLETLPFARKPLPGSPFESIAYLAASQILEGEFKDSQTIYRYYDVPHYIVDAFIATPEDERGVYFYHNIRNNYAYKKVYDPVW